MTINGIFKQPTGFSISHLERHGYARFITAQPPVRRRRDREQGGKGKRDERQRMDSLTQRNLISAWDEIETFAFEGDECGSAVVLGVWEEISCPPENSWVGLHFSWVSFGFVDLTPHYLNLYVYIYTVCFICNANETNCMCPFSPVFPLHKHTLPEILKLCLWPTLTQWIIESRSRPQ